MNTKNIILGSKESAANYININAYKHLNVLVYIDFIRYVLNSNKCFNLQFWIQIF